jgi:hypothetical protein
LKGFEMLRQLASVVNLLMQGIDQVSGEHFLRKPFEATELLAKVLRIISSEASFPKFCDNTTSED